MGVWPSIAALAAAMVALPATAIAQNWHSAYTDLNLERCTIVQQADLSTDFACAGWDGFPVLVRYGEHRVFVSYGSDAKDEMVWQQSVPSINQTGETLEWLLTDGQRPVATILRYFIDRSEIGGPDEQVLVVTKIERGNTCPLAYIDARRNTEANQMAREAARDLVPGWDCETMPARSVGIMGVTGFSQAR